MKVKPPSEMRMQCPICGVPVEALEGERHDPRWPMTHPSIWLDPCGHTVSPASLGIVDLWGGNAS